MASDPHATPDRAAKRYEQMEGHFRVWLREQFPDAQASQINYTARKLAQIAREMNDD